MSAGAVVVDLGAVANAAVGIVDITDLPGTVSDQHNSTGVEGADKVIDNNPYTKLFSQGPTTWIQFTANQSAVVSSYTLTSANDAPDRNPAHWKLWASNDGTSWPFLLDERTGQTFPHPYAKKVYSFSNSASYRYYRLEVLDVDGYIDFQLAEWQLFGTSGDNIPAPTGTGQAPTNIQATAPSADQVVVTWNDNTRWETKYRLERSTNSGATWSFVKDLPIGTTRYRDTLRAGGTAYRYRVRAENAAGSSSWATMSANVTTLSSTPPATITEHFHDPSSGNATLNRGVYDANLAEYHTSDLNSTNLTWARTYVSQVWTRAQAVYGNLAGQRMYAMFHGSPTDAGGTANGIFDGSQDYRSFIDVSHYGWTSNTSDALDLLAHEVSHIVEFSAYGVEGSPARDQWMDSKFAEIFQYDAYLHGGLSSDATRWYNDKINVHDTFPTRTDGQESYWFRDWLYPIYHQHGEGAVLDRFFQLLSTNFNVYNGQYMRGMNMGEFVHFWSGAAGVNLQPLAASAFSWSSQWQAELDQAKIDFPGVTYTP